MFVSLVCKVPVMLWKLDVHWRCQRFFDEASTSLLLDDSEFALISVCAAFAFAECCAEPQRDAEHCLFVWGHCERMTHFLPAAAAARKHQNQHTDVDIIDLSAY